LDMKRKAGFRSKKLSKVGCWIWFLLYAVSPITAWSATRVINDGTPGQNSAEVEARFQTELQKYKPQVVVLFVGMNDAVNDQKFLAPEITAQKLRLMVKQAKGAGCEVVLVSLHEPDVVRLFQRHNPEAYGSRTPAQRIQDVNREIYTVATEEHVPVADFSRALAVAGGATEALSPDGVHMNAKGYALLASTVRRVLSSNLKDDSTILCIGDSLTYGIGVRPAGAAEEGSETYPAQLRALLKQ
jgi:acyl-CoA thioesterase I